MYWSYSYIYILSIISTASINNNMSRTTKDDNLQLEQAYNQVFVKSARDQNIKAVPVEETADEEPEDDKGSDNDDSRGATLTSWTDTPTGT